MSQDGIALNLKNNTFVTKSDVKGTIRFKKLSVDSLHSGRTESNGSPTQRKSPSRSPRRKNFEGSKEHSAYEEAKRETMLLSDEEIKKRKNKHITKIIEDENPASYYDSFPIKPGFNFIKELFFNGRPETFKALKKLRLNVPNTLFSDMTLYYLYNDPDNNDQLTLININKKRNFEVYEEFLQVEKKLYSKEVFRPQDPFFVLRFKSPEYDCSHKVERFEIAREELHKTDGIDDCLIQRYVRSARKKKPKLLSKPKITKTVIKKKTPGFFSKWQNTDNSEFVSVLDHLGGVPSGKNLAPIHGGKRFSPNVSGIYSSNDSRSPSGEKGIRSSNSELLNFTKPSTIRLHYKTKSNSSKKENLAYYLINKMPIEQLVTTLTKETLAKYTEYCSVITSNESSYEVFILTGAAIHPYEFYAEQIVNYLFKNFKMIMLDIVVDFIKDERGVIYFSGVKSFKAIDQSKVYRISIQEYLKNEENRKKIYKTIMCRLCLLSYEQSKINKVVSLKILVKLKANLAKRKIYMFEHIDKNAYHNTMTCRVCDLCYKLIMTENQLEELQKTIGLCMNIPIPSELEFDKKVNVEYEYEHIKEAKQWRVVFYLKTFQNIELDLFALGRKNRFSVFITFMDKSFSFPILNDPKKILAKDEMCINVSRIYYFFTKNYVKKELKNLLDNELVDIRLVLNDDYNNPISSCQTSLINVLDFDENRSMICKKTLNFFSPDRKLRYFICHSYVGVTCDGVLNSEHIRFFNYNKSRVIYLTDEDYYSYHPLPADWMELFDSPFEYFDEENFNYKCGKEIDKLISDLEFKIKTVDEYADGIYEPYDELYNIHKKKKMLDGIISIAAMHDKNREIINYKKDKGIKISTDHERLDQIGDQVKNKIRSFSEVFSIQDYVQEREEKERKVSFEYNKEKLKDLERMVEEKRRRMEELDVGIEDIKRKIYSAKLAKEKPQRPPSNKKYENIKPKIETDRKFFSSKTNGSIMNSKIELNEINKFDLKRVITTPLVPNILEQLPKKYKKDSIHSNEIIDFEKEKARLEKEEKQKLLNNANEMLKILNKIDRNINSSRTSNFNSTISTQYHDR